MTDRFDELVELIAEAARVSPHAAKAYEILRDEHLLLPLASRQEIIAGRMKEVA